MCAILIDLPEYVLYSTCTSLQRSVIITCMNLQSWLSGVTGGGLDGGVETGVWEWTTVVW